MEPILVENFITKSDAISLIRLAEGRLTTGGLATSDKAREYDEKHRNCLVHVLPEETKETIELRNNLAELSGFDVNQFEPTNIMKYEVGHFFKAHPDYFDSADTKYYEYVTNTGGNRLHSFIVCLQEAKKGGVTKFPILNLEFPLKTGDLLHWDNIENGNLLEVSQHEGTIIEEGEKWIAVIWVRQFEYGKKPI